MAKPRRHTLTSPLGSRFHCAGCGKDFRGYRAMNAHHLAEHAGRWAGAKARAAGRKMGKETDKMRRHARGWLESAGLRDKSGRETPKALSRPKPRGKVRARDLRPLHQHDTHHEKADRLRRRALGHARKGRHGRAQALSGKADALAGRWPQLREPAPRRAPAPRARQNGNGRAPAAPRTAPRPEGRLAPAPNGTRARTPRTR